MPKSQKLRYKCQARIEWVLLEMFSGVSIDPPKNSQNFVEKAHYPNATPLKISIRTHSIPAWQMLYKENERFLTESFYQTYRPVREQDFKATYLKIISIMLICCKIQFFYEKWIWMY